MLEVSPAAGQPVMRPASLGEKPRVPATTGLLLFAFCEGCSNALA